MKKLPNHVKSYNRTNSFTENTVPKGLQKEHSTKESIWAKLNVEKGQLTYIVAEPGEEEEIVLTTGQYAVIAPQQNHHVLISDKVTFHLEFYK